MPDYPQRKSPRLAKYDYAQNGLYFVTVCVQNRLSLFGNVRDEIMECNAAGEMVGRWWVEVSKKFPEAATIDYVVMPNHFHGIAVLDQAGTQPDNHVSLSTVVGWFKTMTTNAYMRGVSELGWTVFEGKLWQRSYHDHIIRDELGLLKIQEYIRENPARWSEDTFFVDRL